MKEEIIEITVKDSLKQIERIFEKIEEEANSKRIHSYEIIELAQRGQASTQRLIERLFLCT